MPRQTFDIKEFKYGVISSMDEEDIPPESASDSLNVDGDVGEGILQGIPADVEYQTAGSAALTNVKMGEFIEDGGIYYFVYWDDSDNKIKVIKDFYGVKTKEEITKFTSSLVAYLGSESVFDTAGISIGIITPGLVCFFICK